MNPDAIKLADMVTAARDEFVTQAEQELVTFHHQALLVLLDKDQSAARKRLTPVARKTLIALADLWLISLNGLLEDAHRHFKLPSPTLFTTEQAQEFFRPAVAGLLNSAIRALRLNQATAPIKSLAPKTLTIRQAWDREYAKGGAFVALRGTIRGATAGTYNSYVIASMIDTLNAQNAGKKKSQWVLGAYNPLDERTGALDYALCTNTGHTIRTARGRLVTSIAGRIGKYTLENAFVPGDPRQGGDTHYGCRCVLIPEEL